MSAARTANSGFAAKQLADADAKSAIEGYGLQPVHQQPTKEGALAPEGKYPLAVLILGPTGSGKTALSLALGRTVQWRNRQLRLGRRLPRHGHRHREAHAAKSAPALPHHLIDIADPDQAYTAGEYSRQARAALREITARNHLPIVTGGTGLYLRALLKASSPVRPASRICAIA